MRREPDMYSVMRTYAKVFPGLRDMYVAAPTIHDKHSLADMARSIADNILTDASEQETLAIYNYLLEGMQGRVTQDVLSRNLKRIIANKHILAVDPYALCSLDDDVDSMIACGIFGGIRDTSVDTMNPNRMQMLYVPFTCVTGPLAGIAVRAWLRPSMSLVYGCGLPKRDKYLVWSYFTRCFARVRLSRMVDKGMLDYKVEEVAVTDRMKQHNKELLYARTDIKNGPACIRRTQCCVLCESTTCKLAIRDAKKGARNE